MVNEAARVLEQRTDDAAEAGPHLLVAPKLLVADRGWQAHDLGSSARLTLEDLSRPLSQHSVLLVEIGFYGPVVQGLYTTNHLTAIVNGRVHDLSRMGANGYARTERVKNVFGRP